jgi:hypothetical protein
VLRKIFGPKRDEVTEGCRNLHNEVFHNSYSSTIIIIKTMKTTMILAGHVAHMKKMRYSYEILLGKSERKRSYG